MVPTSTHVPVLMGILDETVNLILTNACHCHVNTMDSVLILTAISIAIVQRLDMMGQCVKQVMPCKNTKCFKLLFL